MDNSTTAFLENLRAEGFKIKEFDKKLNALLKLLPVSSFSSTGLWEHDFSHIMSDDDVAAFVINRRH
jgi:hypothetical protein